MKSNKKKEKKKEESIKAKKRIPDDYEPKEINFGEPVGPTLDSEQIDNFTRKLKSDFESLWK